MPDARRSFLKALAAAPLAPAALAAEPPATPPAASPSAPSGAAVSSVEGVAEALAEAVRREHGEHLDAGGLEAVRKQIARSLENAAKMRRALPLANGDQPIPFFSAWVRR